MVAIPLNLQLAISFVTRAGDARGRRRAIRLIREGVYETEKSVGQDQGKAPEVVSFFVNCHPEFEVPSQTYAFLLGYRQRGIPFAHFPSSFAFPFLLRGCVSFFLMDIRTQQQQQQQPPPQHGAWES